MYIVCIKKKPKTGPTPNKASMIQGIVPTNCLLLLIYPPHI